MGPPKRVSFRIGEKRKFTAESSKAPRLGPRDPTPDQGDKGGNHAPELEQSNEVSTQCVAGHTEPELKSAKAVAKATTPPIDSKTSDKSSSDRGSALQLLRSPNGLATSMAEPPAKRAKRTDSSAMWERNSSRAADADDRRSAAKEMTNGRDRRDDRDRYHGRDDARRRSRSRDRTERRRERSRSRDRDGGRYRNGERGVDRDRRGRERTASRERKRRDRERTTSRERHRSRRDDPPPRRSDRHHTRSRSPPRRSDRHRTRSRSPTRSDKPPARTRSPPRGPSIKAAPSKPQPTNPTTKPSPSTALPPIEPRKPERPHPARNPQMSMTDSPPPATNGTKPLPSDPSATAMDVDSDPETAQLRKMMGFATFKTTKNTKVPGNNVSAVRKEKKTEYRQYMNRVGGFNRPLSPSR